MRRKHSASHENHERWLVSYADFITLLFAFFVVMFASSQSDKNKAKEVSDSVRDALEHGQFSNAISTVLGRGKHEPAGPLPDAVEVDRSRPPGRTNPTRRTWLSRFSPCKPASPRSCGPPRSVCAWKAGV